MEEKMGAVYFVKEGDRFWESLSEKKEQKKV